MLYLDSYKIQHFSNILGYGQGIAFATGDDTVYGKMLKKTVVLQKKDTSVHKRIRKVLLCLGAITLATGVFLLGMALLAHYPWMTLMTVILAQVIVSTPGILYTAATVRRSRLLPMLFNRIQTKESNFYLFSYFFKVVS